jgi:hypothetical protein
LNADEMSGGAGGQREASTVAGRRSRMTLFYIFACVVLAPLIIACLAGPPLVARFFAPKPSLELSAVEALRAYCKAQKEYRRVDHDDDGKLEYASSLDELADLGLIPAEMADARGMKGTPYRGYLFREIKTIAGKPVDWQYDYALSAIPAKYGRTGYRTFIVSTNEFIMGPDRGRGAGFVDDYPENPVAEGWIIPD